MKPSSSKNPYFLTLAAILALGCGASGDEGNRGASSTAQPCRPAPEDDVSTRLTEVWSKAVERGFSGTAFVRHKGRELGRFSSGLRHREEALPNTLNTVFCIGSITKQFTAAAILKLYEQGRLSLETTLGEFFPDVPPDRAGVTVHQLLTHTAGLPSAIGFDHEPIERDAYLARAWQRPLVISPGERFFYSNTGYSLLAAILEQVTERPYEEYVVNELLRPLGILQTGYASIDWNANEVAWGYQDGAVDDPLSRARDEDGYYWNLRGNGGLLSTAADLTRWVDAFSSGDVLGPEALALYSRPHVSARFGSSYGYGWSFDDTNVGRLIHHNGGNGFFYATVERYVDADLLVIVLANESSPTAETLSVDLANAVLPALPSSAELPDYSDVFAVDRFEELAETTQTLVETVEMTDDRASGVAAFSVLLLEGRAAYRVIDPTGIVVAEGEDEAQALVERLVPIPRRLGEWRLELELEEATGFANLVWLWE